MTSPLIRLIQVGCRELGIAAEDRHALQERLTGKASLSDMTEAELTLVVDNLKTMGFKPTGGTRRQQAPRADLRLIHVMWRALGEAGKLRDPSRKGLNAFISKRFGKVWGFVPSDVDSLRDHAKIDAVIRALTDWITREGVDFDWGRVKR